MIGSKYRCKWFMKEQKRDDKIFYRICRNKIVYSKKIKG